MKNTFSLLFALLLASVSSFAQALPVRTATVFKNSKSLIYKSGKVPVKDGKWSTTDLPAALFGTFWVSSPTDDLASVFSRQDSVEVKVPLDDDTALLEKNIGKRVSFLLSPTTFSSPHSVTGVLEKVEKLHPSNHRVYLRTEGGGWTVFNASQIVQMSFSENPAMNVEMKTISKKAVETLGVQFKNNKPEQEIGMLYLANNLGWTPVYSLTLTDKGKSRLALRAEIANDAEDLGDTELRLAVGIPNFAFADRPDWLVNFAKTWQWQGPRNYNFDNQLQLQSNYNRSEYSQDDILEPSSPDENFEGAQAEDFYFYTVRPGNFPKNSRYQYPIFETDVEPTHFYECQLSDAGPGKFEPTYEPRRDLTEPRSPVLHYVEFANPTQFPFTTGSVNILSQTGGSTYPLSQDKLPYTPSAGKCKVKIAQTPEIKVTHGEGELERKSDAFLFFNRRYHEIKLEGQVVVVNYKKEPVTLKVKRKIEGSALSSEQKWTTRQAQATLRANPSHEVEWVVELKPGEEKNWKYTYRVYVDF